MLYEGLEAGIMAQGPTVPWTSGTISRFTHVPTPHELGLVSHESSDVQQGSGVARLRECGDPASDGYALTVE